MTVFYVATATLLLLILIAGLVRALLGPTPSDRMLTPQLFGTVGVAVLVLSSGASGQVALLDVALVLALLAPLTLIAFIKE